MFLEWVKKVLYCLRDTFQDQFIVNDVRIKLRYKENILMFPEVVSTRVPKKYWSKYPKPSNKTQKLNNVAKSAI